jgi:hypothetical protein
MAYLASAVPVLRRVQPLLQPLHVFLTWLQHRPRRIENSAHAPAHFADHVRFGLEIHRIRICSGWPRVYAYHGFVGDQSAL